MITVTLKVTDAAGNWDTGTIIVTVNDTKKPLADAGLNQYRNQTETVTFNGEESSDNVGIINFSWSFKDNEEITLYGKKASYNFINAGMFTIMLRIMDAAGNSDTDTLVVTVNDTTSPIAKAGRNLTIGQKTEVFLDGTNSTDNVGIVSYQWSLKEGGKTKLLSGEYVRYTFIDPGRFNITLMVEDVKGNRDFAVITVTVLDSQKPTANAGDDLTVYKGTTVTLDGNDSKDNVDVVSYLWSFNDGIKIKLSGVNPSYIFNNTGTYTITLIVNDIAGNQAVDRVMITVEDTINHVMFTTVRESVSKEDKQKIHLTLSKSMLEEYGIEHIELEFGDGHSEIITLSDYPNDDIITIDHRYTKEGDYIITIRAIDKTGYAFVTKKALNIAEENDYMFIYVIFIAIVVICSLLLILRRRRSKLINDAILKEIEKIEDIKKEEIHE